MNEEWKSSGGRITLFRTQSPLLLSAVELYRQMWTEEPDSSQRPQNPIMPAVAQGKRGNLTAACIVNPTRIDFTLSPATPTEPVQGYFPLIDDTGTLHTELSRIISTIAQYGTAYPTNRVALGLQFLAGKPSSAEANRLLAAVIPSQYGVRLAGEEDFVFQVNRPFPSRTVEGLRMNFLVKWSVDRLQILTLALPTSGVAPLPASPATAPLTEQFIAASVTFDVNSVPTDNPLQHPSALLNETLAAAGDMQGTIGLKIEGF